jgi:hypothetical protein
MDIPRNSDTADKGPLSADDLTCTEGQVEDLFSEGESTETDDEDGDKSQPKKKPHKPSSR